MFMLHINYSGVGRTGQRSTGEKLSWQTPESQKAPGHRCQSVSGWERWAWVVFAFGFLCALVLGVCLAWAILRPKRI